MSSGIHLSQVGGLKPTKVTSFFDENSFSFTCPASTACNWYYFGQNITVNGSETIYGNPNPQNSGGSLMQHMSGWIQAGGTVNSSAGYGSICTIYHYSYSAITGQSDSGGLTVTF